MENVFSFSICLYSESSFHPVRPFTLNYFSNFNYIALIYNYGFLFDRVAQAILLRLLIQTFNDGNAESWKGYAYAGGISAVVFLHTLTIHPGVFQIMHLGMKLRVGLSMLIYRKVSQLEIKIYFLSQRFY